MINEARFIFPDDGLLIVAIVGLVGITAVWGTYMWENFRSGK